MSQNKAPVKGDRWWSVVSRAKRGWQAKVYLKAGDLSFCYHRSKPIASKAHAHAHAKEVQAALEQGRPQRPVVGWSWYVVERTAKTKEGPKKVYVGTVRKWLGDRSFVWRQISPQDKREDAESLVQQTVQAGRALEIHATCEYLAKRVAEVSR